MPFICATRALKTARRLQDVAPEIIPRDEPAEGFASLVPFEVLSRLHQMTDAELQSHPRLVEAAQSLRSRVAKTSSSGLFEGTLYFVQISFNVNGTVTQVSDTDMETLIQYGTAVADPISGYAAQYGSNSVTVSPTKLTFSVDVPTGKFNDGTLQGWCKSILKANNLSGGSACLVIPHPRGTTNTDGDATKGIGGYHGKTDCPYCYVNVFGTGFTLADRPDSQAADHYALQLSHEIAEMVVDPDADDSNPECCDPCGPNCGRVWRDFFFGPPINSYMLTTQTWPPAADFDYGFMINAIVQPSHAGDCPAAQSACDYSPAVSAPNQLLFYEASDGVGENWASIAPFYINLQRHYEGWRTDWTSIIPGNFSGKSPQTPLDVLFYEASSGTGEFYQVDIKGNFNLLNSNTGWRSSWNMIIPGNFSDSPFTDLLFYDAAAGVGEFYETDGHGGLSLIQTNTGWRSDWSIIVAGNYTGGKYNDLLFYQREAGIGDFWRTDGHGNISQIQTNSWRNDWSIIAPGHFSDSPYDDLLFYQRDAGIGDFWRCDGHGNVSQIGSSNSWNNNWTFIIPGNYFGDSLTDILFYQRESGIGDFWRPDGKGDVSQIRSFTDWRNDWSIIVKH
jgi:hypothetical protein